MPRGKHMVGKTNNPGGRPRTDYLPPWNSRNIWKIWKLPPAERILLDLEQVGGNLDKFLSKACSLAEHRESLLVEILNVLEREGNEEYLQRWKALTERNERARLTLLEQNVFSTLQPTGEDVDKVLSAQHISALKFILQSRMPERYKRNALAALPTEKPKQAGKTATELAMERLLSATSSSDDDVD